MPPECKRGPNWTLHITADLAHASDLERFVAEAKGLFDGALHALSTIPGCLQMLPQRSGLALSITTSKVGEEHFS